MELKTHQTKVKNFISLHRKTIRLTILSVLAVIMLLGVIILARFVTQNDNAQLLVQDFGYIGVIVISFVAGLNAIVPIPAGSFVPVFTAAGLDLQFVILMLIIGTTIADLAAWYVGVLGRKITLHNYPKLAKFTNWIQQKNIWAVMLFVFVYASVAPIPNEVILIPLALVGIKLRYLIVPLIMGTILYQTAFAFGAQSLFDWWFA